MLVKCENQKVRSPVQHDTTSAVFNTQVIFYRKNIDSPVIVQVRQTTWGGLPETGRGAQHCHWSEWRDGCGFFLHMTDNQDKSVRTAAPLTVLMLFSCSTDSLAPVFSIEQRLMTLKEHSGRVNLALTQRKSAVDTAEVSTSRQSGTDRQTG